MLIENFDVVIFCSITFDSKQKITKLWTAVQIDVFIIILKSMSCVSLECQYKQKWEIESVYHSTE